MTDSQQVAEARYERLEELPLVSYRAKNSLLTGFFSATSAVLKQKRLLGLLVRRELRGRYKDSSLGVVWSLARPLAQLFIYYLVVGQFLGAARNIENFAIFIFAGLTIYGLFSEGVNSMTVSIVVNAGLVKKVYLPREIFPLAAMGGALFDFALQTLILTVGALLMGTLVFGVNLLYGLGAFILVLIWTLATGLFLSAANVRLRDTQFLTQVVTMLLMWFSPIVYSWTFVRDVFHNAGLDWLTQVYLANPITVMVLGFQEAFWAPTSGGELLPNLPLRMVITLVVGLILLWFAQHYFAKDQANFAQEL